MDTAESSEQKKPGRAIYLLPNLFTTAGMFAGYFAIVASMRGDYVPAVMAIIIAMLMDGVDGRVARMTNTQSEFGAQYDSLADLVSFGMAPALVMFNWSLSSMAEMGTAYGKVGWLIAFFYTAMAALRLARFNVQIGKADKAFFTGLASPAAATLVASFIWVCETHGIKGTEPMVLAASIVITIMAAALMVSPIRYLSFKAENRDDRVPFTVLIFVVLLMIAIIMYPPGVFFGIFLFYTLSGPLRAVFSRKKMPEGTPEEGMSE